MRSKSGLIGRTCASMTSTKKGETTASFWGRGVGHPANGSIGEEYRNTYFTSPGGVLSLTAWLQHLTTTRRFGVQCRYSRKNLAHLFSVKIDADCGFIRYRISVTLRRLELPFLDRMQSR